MTTKEQHTAAQRRGGARLLLPFVGAGVLIALVGIGLKASLPATQTVSEVVRNVQAMALKGAWLGPLRIQATGTDAATGDLLGFNATSDTLMFVAARARLEIDPHADTISFHLTDVVLTKVPEVDSEEPGGLRRIEMYELGPVPYQYDIIPDAALLPAGPASGIADASSDR